MQTLREVRLKHGLSQGDIARVLNSQIPTISNWETGKLVPSVEEITILEQKFSRPLKWNETISPGTKHQIIQAFITLAEAYPLATVINFIQSNYRTGLRRGQPAQTIVHYAELSQSVRVEPLAPTGITFKNEK